MITLYTSITANSDFKLSFHTWKVIGTMRNTRRPQNLGFQIALKAILFMRKINVQHSPDLFLGTYPLFCIDSPWILTTGFCSRLGLRDSTVIEYVIGCI